MAERDDEFYTGYLPAAPPGIARRVRLAVMLIFAVTVAVALILVFAQQGFSSGVYEFLVVRDFAGVVRESPYPSLEVRRPGQAGVAEATSAFSLVRPGKLGAAADVEGLDGKQARLSGSLLYLDGQTMVEIVPGSLQPIAGDGAAAGAGRSLGRQTLVGEIIDSKCYYGIMKPGHGKPHKACAIRCIAGGVPPLLVVSDGGGPAAYLMLVGADGRALNQEILGRVAEPVEITGEVVRFDDLFILKAEPDEIRGLR